MPTSPRPTERRAPAGTAGAQLAVAALGTLLTLVAFTAPMATLNSTAAALGAGTSGRTWILSSMSIGLGAALLSTGTIADDFGRRRTFVAGMLVLGARLGAGGAVARTRWCSCSPGWSRASAGRRCVASSLGHHRGDLPARPAPRGGERRVGGQRRRRHRGRAAAGGRARPAARLARRLRADPRRRAALAAVAALRLVAESRSAERPAARPPRGGAARRRDERAARRAGRGPPGLDRRPGRCCSRRPACCCSAGFVVVERRSARPMLDLALFRHPPFVAATVPRSPPAPG